MFQYREKRYCILWLDETKDCTATKKQNIVTDDARLATIIRSSRETFSITLWKLLQEAIQVSTRTRRPPGILLLPRVPLSRTHDRNVARYLLIPTFGLRVSIFRFFVLIFPWNVVFYDYRRKHTRVVFLFYHRRSIFQFLSSFDVSPSKFVVCLVLFKERDYRNSGLAFV